MSERARFAVVTGASSGIGAAYAEQLAQRGHNLILVARRRDRLEALAVRLTEAHRRDVVIHTADLSSSDEVAGIERLFADRGDIDFLVNNAGIGALGPTAMVGAEAIERLIRINVVALTRLSLAAAAAFAKRGGGTIVNIASIIGLMPSPNGGAYGASKAYVLNFSRSLQMEYQAAKVTIQAVMPGPVRTEFFDAVGRAPFPDHLFMSADDLAKTALSSLDHGEQVTFPTLPDAASWSTFEDARKAFVGAAMATGRPAARFT